MKPITIVLTENYSDWEIAPLAGAGRAFYDADIRFASPDGGALVSVAGLAIAETERLAAPFGGVIVVCGGPAFEQDAPDLTARLHEARQAGCPIAAICGGTIALARAGLLDDTRHTSNAPGYLEQHARQYAGSALYVDQPRAISANGIITAPAPAPASFAAEVLTAAGLDRDQAEQLKAMLGAEHAT